MAENPINLNDSSPAAPAGSILVKFLGATPDPNPTVVRDTSAYVATPNDSTKVLCGDGVFRTPSSGGGMTSTVHQVAHGFSTGQAVYFTGSVWALAKSDAVGTLGIAVIVVSGADDFTAYFGGPVTGLSGLTAGQYYFVSDSVAGTLSTTEPTTIGHYSNPLLLATSTTAGVAFPFRPSQLEPSPSRVLNKNTGYTAVGGDIVRVDASGAPVTIVLDLSASNTALRVVVKKMDASANAVTIARSGADLIDNATSKTIASQFGSFEFAADGSTNWDVI